MKKALIAGWSVAAAALFAGESLVPDVTDNLWARGAGTKIVGNGVEVSPVAGRNDNGISFLLPVEANAVYDMTFTVSLKNAPGKQDRLRWQINNVNYCADEIALPGKTAKARAFVFNNDIAGKKWLGLNYNYEAGSGNVMTVSGFKLEKVDPAALTTIVLNEPAAWTPAGWSKFATRSFEPAADFVEEGDAVTLSVGNDVKAGREAWILSSFFPFAADSEYEVSAWLKTDAPGNVSLGVNSWIDEKEKHYWKMNGFQTTTEWKQYKFTVKTPSVKEFPVFRLGRTRGAVSMKIADGGARKVYIRNWTITKK